MAAPGVGVILLEQIGQLQGKALSPMPPMPGRPRLTPPSFMWARSSFSSGSRPVKSAGESVFVRVVGISEVFVAGIE